jgi:hypothetical protein
MRGSLDAGGGEMNCRAKIDIIPWSPDIATLCEVQRAGAAEVAKGRGDERRGERGSEVLVVPDTNGSCRSQSAAADRGTCGWPRS